MSECKCEKPYTYGESLAREAENNGGLVVVAPMMPMEACLRCYGTRNATVNLNKKELAKRVSKKTRGA